MPGWTISYISAILGAAEVKSKRAALHTFFTRHVLLPGCLTMFPSGTCQVGLELSEEPITALQWPSGSLRYQDRLKVHEVARPDFLTVVSVSASAGILFCNLRQGQTTCNFRAELNMRH